MRAAVIGVGVMGINHTRILAEMQDVELVAVADKNAEVAEHVSELYQVKGYADYRKLLESERPEIVTVAVPSTLHYEVALSALEAEAHVLVEKPIAVKVEDGQDLITKAEAFGLKLMVGHIFRFNPAIKTLKEKLDDGELGEIYQIGCRRVGPRPLRIQDVGIVIDLAPHDVDLMCYLLNDEPIQVFAEIQRNLQTQHADILSGTLRFSNNVTGLLELNWVNPIKERELFVLGENGKFHVNEMKQELIFYETPKSLQDRLPVFHADSGANESNMIRYDITHEEPLRLELKAFVQSVQENTPPAINGDDGLRALQIALALKESGEIQKPVLLPTVGEAHAAR